MQTKTSGPWIRWHDVAIHVQEVGNELSCGDIGKTRMLMLEGVDVKTVNGTDYLLFECGINIGVLTPHSEGLFVVSDGGADLGGCAVGSDDW
jgi:hypothetical protein